VLLQASALPPGPQYKLQYFAYIWCGCRLLMDFTLNGSTYQDMLLGRLHDPVYDGPPTPAERARHAFITEAGRQLRESYAAAPLTPQQLMWNDLLLDALRVRGPLSHVVYWMQPEPSVEDFDGEDMIVYMTKMVETLKQQMNLYEQMFGRTGDGKAAAVVGTAAAAPDAGAGEVGSDSAGSSSSERRWPTARNLHLEAEWIIRWAP
jgi:hypothetical protein